MAKQEKGVNPEKVKTLIRKISKERYFSEVRKLGWKRLAKWQEAKNCRLAIEAILSCALEKDSPFYEKAHKWLKKNINLPLVQAVTIYEANRNDICRKNILLEIVDKYGLPSIIFQELWQKLKEKPFDWETIIKAFTIKDYLPNPRTRQIDYWEACRWVMENPKPENIVTIADDILSEHQAVSQSTKLQKIITTNLLKHNSHGSRSLFKAQLTILWQGVLEILKMEYYHLEEIAYGDGTRFLLETIIARFNDFDTDKVNDLVKINNLNVWTLADLILPKAPASDELTQFLIDLKKYNSLIPHYIGEIKRDKILWNSDVQQEIINNLPLEKVADYLAKIGDFSRLSENPNFCHKVFGDKVREGEATLQQVVNYLDVVGDSKLARIELNGWLRRNKEDLSDYQKNQQALERLIREFIIPWNLPLGGLMMNTEVVNFVCKIGHQLSDDDEENLAAIISLKSHFREIEEIPVWNFWENEHWRKTILSMLSYFRPEQRNLIAISLILTLDKEKLVFIFTKNPKLIEALQIIACSEEYSSAICKAALVFIELLLEQKKDLFTSEKIDFIHNELVFQEYLLHHLVQNHPKILENLFTKKELAEIFFEYLGKIAERGTTLPNSYDFITWLEKIGALPRLVKWLVKNKPKNDNVLRWLDWAIYFKDNPGIRHATRKFLESKKEKIAMKALEFFKD